MPPSEHQGMMVLVGASLIKKFHNLAIVDDPPLSELQEEPKYCGYSINDD